MIGVRSTDGRVLSASRKRRGEKTHRGTFMVEAMLLLLIVMLLVSVVMSVLAFSYLKGVEASEMNVAITAAANAAERFAADPANAPEVQEVDGCTITCETDAEPTVGGVLYQATISVARDGEELYELQTSAYASDAGVADGS